MRFRFARNGLAVARGGGVTRTPQTMTDSADNRIWTGADLRAVAAELYGSPQGAIPALAERLGLDRRLVGRWASGTTPIPASAAARIQNITGVSAPLETGWRRDEWLVADGPAQADGSRRVYVIHTWPPRFRCRVVAVEPGTGLPEPGEEPADIVNGLVHEAGPDTVLAEFDWIDRPPAEEALVALLYAAADALAENLLE